MKFRYLNEAGLGKIMAIGGGLAGAGMAGLDFMHDINSGANEVQSLTDATKMPVYGLAGVVGGGLAGAGLSAANAKPKKVSVSNMNTTARYNR